jgi:hypothetical protein
MTIQEGKSETPVLQKFFLRYREVPGKYGSTEVSLFLICDNGFFFILKFQQRSNFKLQEYNRKPALSGAVHAHDIISSKIKI